MLSRQLLKTNMVFVALLAPLQCLSQTYTIGDIRGIVTIRYFDERSGKPSGRPDDAAQGFIIVAIGDTYSASTTTNVNGDFRIYNLKAGTWHIQALKKGYLQTCRDNANVDVRSCPVIATLGTDKTQEEVPDPLHMKRSTRPRSNTHAQTLSPRLALTVYRTFD